MSEKSVTHRVAIAQAVVSLPPPLAALLKEGDIATRKGAIFQTAVLAGIMGAKRTSDLIPLCHPLPLTHCSVTIDTRPAHSDGSVDAVILSRAETHDRTGVEMEALTAASVAALTLYDMGKGISHDIVIRELRLLEKSGGKHPFTASPPVNAPAQITL